MRMENCSSIENVITKSKPQDSEYLNHKLSNNEEPQKSSNNVDVNKSKNDSVNDNHLDSAREELKNNDDVECLIDNDETPLSGSRCNELCKESVKNISTNGDIHDTDDSPVQNPLPNDVTHVENEPDTECSLNDRDVSNDTRTVNPSRDASSPSNEKNITNTSCDSEDYLSATDVIDITEVPDEDQLDDLNEESIRNGDQRSNLSDNDQSQDTTLPKIVDADENLDDNDATLPKIINIDENLNDNSQSQDTTSPKIVDADENDQSQDSNVPKIIENDENPNDDDQSQDSNLPKIVDIDETLNDDQPQDSNIPKIIDTDENSRTDVVTIDQTDNFAAKDNSVESSNDTLKDTSNSVTQQLDVEDQTDNHPDPIIESDAMEVEECDISFNINDSEEQTTSKSNANSEENVQQVITSAQAAEHSEKQNDIASDCVVTNSSDSNKEPTTDESSSKSVSENAANASELGNSKTTNSESVSEAAITEKEPTIEARKESTVEDSASNTSTSAEKSNEKDSQNVATEENSDPKCTEVLHVDQNDEDNDEIMDTTECDPFGQVTENAENNNVEVEEMEVDGISSKDGQEDVEVEVVTEVDLVDDNSTSCESTSKTSQAKESVSQTDDQCIIPDKVSSEPPKTYERVKPKFDIMPVRLEKLMDPSKLANSKGNDLEIVRDAEPSGPSISAGRPQRRAAKKAETQIKEIVAQTESENPFGNIEDVEQLAEPSVQVCYRCSRLRQCKYVASLSTKTIYICQDSCLGPLNDKRIPSIKCISKLSPIISPKPLSSIPDSIHFLRKCSHCGLHNIVDEKSLSWEAMDFCNEECLSRYQTQHGAFCAFCNGNVLHASMGKYSVRFGLEARQFCSGSCLEEFKKGLKSCSYCQQDITKGTNVVSAQIGEKMQLKDFCSQSCVEKYERICSNAPLPVTQDMCTVCAQKKNVEVQVLIQSKTHSLCSDVCFMTFKFANNISDIDQCHICKKYYEDQNTDSYFVFHEDAPYNFCSKICMNVFILFKRKIVPCSWCKVKKYNFDMIKKSINGGNCVMMCSLNCLTLYQVSMNATTNRKTKCDYCSNVNFAQYHLTMSDATIRNFCSYNCVMVFQAQYNKTPLSTSHDHNKSNVVPLGGPKRAVLHQKTVVSQSDIQRTSIPSKAVSTIANGLLPQLTASSTQLKISNPLTVASATGSNLPIISSTTTRPPLPPKYIQQIIVKPPKPEETMNKSVQCLPNTATKGVSCRPIVASQETQTDEVLKYPAVVPIPVPIYVPTPMHMFTTPFPVPVPFALPIPVPIFIPTSKNTYKGVMQQIKEIMDKTPANPFEADLLLMAKMVAGEDKTEAPEETAKPESSEDDDMNFADAAADLSDGENFADNETTVSTNFTEDVLQMAMKMATEQLSNSPTVDLEAELTSNTITPQTQTEDTTITTEVPEVPIETKPPRTRKRANKSSSDTPTRKRGRQQAATQAENESHSNTASSQPSSDISSPPLTAEGERPDANMCLKYTIGIRAWKQWVLSKNDQIEQAAAAANKKAKTFNTNILKLTTDELNYLLCLFVKEVRKPNGMEYAPDTVYYLCLSIQQYLFENGRIDNIFTDSFYEPFTNALDEVARKFSEVNDATQYIVTRVEEEHLWESKQLGAHSPHVLLATLMFFNTKYFNLATLEEHMQLSFSHIMKHWKRNPNTPVGKPGSPAPNRNVVLRFYPPQAALDAPNSRKKKVYEQHENEVNPLRCPVKLYEFYLSKCPESVKQRNDVFYLQPERSCVPDSPVWYSTMPLQKDLLMKMLHRIRMVKEVNISLLAS